MVTFRQSIHIHIPGRRDTAIPNFYILEGAQMLPISVPQDDAHPCLARQGAVRHPARAVRQRGFVYAYGHGDFLFPNA